MRHFKSCGFLIFRRQPRVEFLLMRHADRWDLPKGHVDGDETDLQCALRELEEETGIAAGDIEIANGFRFETRYVVRVKYSGFQPAEKTLVVFLAWLRREVEITLTEHSEYHWLPWQPPHRIQAATIDSLLAQVEAFFAGQPLSSGAGRE